MTRIQVVGVAPARAPIVASGGGRGVDQASALFGAMADALAAEPALAFDYDSALDVLTDAGQKLTIACSGSVALQRPDRLSATRIGGFATIEAHFDGRTLTVASPDEGLYAEEAVPGGAAGLLAALRDFPATLAPAADLLLSDAFGVTAPSAWAAQDLGAGVVGARICDHLAFRSAGADWQIWISQDAAPFPVRLSIAAPEAPGGLQFSVDFRGWRTGAEALAALKPVTRDGATRVALADLTDAGDLPEICRRV